VGKVSAGIVGHRWRGDELEVLLVHPGGPLWVRKDEGAWSIPKGELDPDEAPADAARRELREETGWEVGDELVPLGTITQKAGKQVHGFGAPLDVDPVSLVSGTFTMEWPRGSGQIREFPEVDRAAWFDLGEARRRINPAQIPLLERLAAALGARVPW
jgi:predicted NUDIX family NTP pyrophosphohydrolase